MGIYGALFSGVTGLFAQSQALGVISDNISNVNTVGYKSTKAQFSTLVTRSPTPTSYAPGGVRSSPYAMIDRQGLLQASDAPTDIAVSGGGFFVVNEAAAAGVGDDFMYTRAGAFAPDADGNLRNTAGYFLQGWRLDPDGSLAAGVNPNVLTGLETVNVANLTGLVEGTELIAVAANLPADATPFDETTATAADIGSTYPMTVQVYDSLGVGYDLSLRFAADATTAGQWNVFIQDLTRASDGTTVPPGAPVVDPTDPGTWIPVGSLDFDTSGRLTGGAAGTPVNLTFDLAAAGFTLGNAEWGAGGGSNTIDLNVGNYGDVSGLTQFSSSYLVSRIDQDGVQFGAFNGVRIDENGIVTALFDNGQSLSIFQIPLATFPNANGLEARTGNAWIETDRSGPYFLRAPNTGGAGAVAAGSLEGSTVDLANEFTQMIVTQRAYSASARIITTADEMLDELVRIKR
jgi:flagellar hook protein FlgE